MLKQRVVTAIVLVVLILATLQYLNDVVWCVFVGMVAALGLMEYMKMTRMAFLMKIITFSLYVIALLLVYLMKPNLHLTPIPYFILLFWLIYAPLTLRYRWDFHRQSAIVAMILGLVLFLPTAYALILFKGIPLLSITQNQMIAPFSWTWIQPLVFLCVSVWIADIAAFFIGKTYANYIKTPKKIAPMISPGKTWAGALGALIAVAAYVYYLLSDLLVGLFSWYFWIPLTAIAVFLTAFSIIGDLLESLFKRQADMKDSGYILPGHGGVYDRIDSLVAILSIAVSIWLIILQQLPS
jgi:phosphatidate cytidylyltransferase